MHTFKWIFGVSGGEEYQARLDLLSTCSLGSVRLCVVSEYEMKKCEQMLLALRSKNLRVCVLLCTNHNNLADI